MFVLTFDISILTTCSYYHCCFVLLSLNIKKFILKCTSPFFIGYGLWFLYTIVLITQLKSYGKCMNFRDYTFHAQENWKLDTLYLKLFILLYLFLLTVYCVVIFVFLFFESLRRSALCLLYFLLRWWVNLLKQMFFPLC